MAILSAARYADGANAPVRALIATPAPGACRLDSCVAEGGATNLSRIESS